MEECKHSKTKTFYNFNIGYHEVCLDCKAKAYPNFKKKLKTIRDV